jgi:hypothetical protein
VTPGNIDNDPVNNREKYHESNERRMTPAQHPQQCHITCPFCKAEITLGNCHQVYGARQDERERVLAPLKAVYERFKHLDEILMDHEFDDGGMQRPIQRECWKAIKESLREHL